MKFISFSYNKTDDSALDIYVMPDTALHINKRPFFIPDYAFPCMMHLHRAIHICRLGKNIGERFASRYYDAVTLCARMEAPNMPDSIGRTFDECVTVGEWLKTETIQTDHRDEMGQLDNLAPLAAKAIATVSHYYTLRQGDVILLDEIVSPEEVHINQHVEKTFSNTDVLCFNIK